MQILKKSILLSFTLQASFMLNIGARRLSGKSSKSAKQPKSVCIQEAFEIEAPEFDGGTDGIYNYQDFCQTCCNPVCGIDPTDTTDYCGWGNFPNVNFEQECADDFTLSYPFSFNIYDTSYSMDGVRFSFTDQESYIGDTSFKGEIVDPDTGRKVILKYLSEPFDPAEFSRNLVGRPLSNLEYIEYSFKANSCDNTNTVCPYNFYMNVYTKDPSDTTNWYNCRFDFRPEVGADATTGDWTTVRFSKKSTPTGGSCLGTSCSSCPVCGDIGGSDCAVTLEDLGSSLVLGNIHNEIFTFNMGDTNADDGGLEGYFDRIVMKFDHEDGPRVYDL